MGSFSFEAWGLDLLSVRLCGAAVPHEGRSFDGPETLRIFVERAVQGRAVAGAELLQAVAHDPVHLLKEGVKDRGGAQCGLDDLMDICRLQVGEHAIGHTDIAAAAAQVTMALAGGHVVPESLFTRDGILGAGSGEAESGSRYFP